MCALSSGMEAMTAQQTAMMAQRVKELSTCVEVAEEVADNVATQGSETAQSGDMEPEALQKITCLEADVPQMCGLHNEKPTTPSPIAPNSPMRYKQLFLPRSKRSG